MTVAMMPVAVVIVSAGTGMANVRGDCAHVFEPLLSLRSGIAKSVFRR